MLGRDIVLAIEKEKVREQEEIDAKKQWLIDNNCGPDFYEKQAIWNTTPRSHQRALMDASWLGTTDGISEDKSLCRRLETVWKSGSPFVYKDEDNNFVLTQTISWNGIELFGEDEYWMNIG